MELVPHGGYVASCFLRVASVHFSTTLRSQNQPHTLFLHLSFLRRTSLGPSIFTVIESKLGRRTSTIHISLALTSNPQSPCVVGYLTQTNLHYETGITLSTSYGLSPPPLPLASTEALKEGRDTNWRHYQKPFPKFRKAGNHVTTYLPRKSLIGEGAVIDQWLRPTNAQERFTQETLGYISDTFPQIIETVYSASELNDALDDKPSSTNTTDTESQKLQHSTPSNPEETDKSYWARFWYPTVVLNIEFKKALPEEGVEWLFSRVRAKKIGKGRMDLEVEIRDEGGEVVALSQHVALILGAERNMSGRGAKL